MSNHFLNDASGIMRLAITQSLYFWMHHPQMTQGGRIPGASTAVMGCAAMWRGGVTVHLKKEKHAVEQPHTNPEVNPKHLFIPHFYLQFISVCIDKAYHNPKPFQSIFFLFSFFK